MAIGANSYGSVVEVEALTTQYTEDRKFNASTFPTDAQVEKFIDRVSATLNALLAQAGFEIAISQADAKLVCDEFVVESVVDLVDAVNRTGRFYRDTVGSKSRWAMIREDAADFLEAHYQGLEDLGATRTSQLGNQLGYNAEDDAGNIIEPVYQREMMRQKVIDWVVP